MPIFPVDPSQPNSQVIANDLVITTRNHLTAGQIEERNKLAQPISASDDAIIMEYDLRGITTGATIAIGLEVFYVWAPSGEKGAVVSRGEMGSKPIPHEAGEIVVVRPRFPDWLIFSRLNDEIRSLSSPLNGLFAVKTVDIEYDASIHGYDLTTVTDIVSDLAVHVGPYAGNVENDWTPVRSYEIIRDMPNSAFASGKALILHEGVGMNRPIRFTYRAPFTPFVSLNDAVSATGLSASMYDIPPLGATARLIPPKEVKRNQTDSQGDTRRAEEVPPNAIANSSRLFFQMRDERIMEEAARLHAAYPRRKSFPTDYRPARRYGYR